VSRPKGSKNKATIAKQETVSSFIAPVVDLIQSSTEKKHRGRPKKIESVVNNVISEPSVASVVDGSKKHRGRPKKIESINVAEMIGTIKKHRGRPTKKVQVVESTVTPAILIIEDKEETSESSEEPVVEEIPLSTSTTDESVEKKKRKIRSDKKPVPIKRNFSVVNDGSKSSYWLADDVLFKDIEDNVILDYKFIVPDTRMNIIKAGDIHPIKGIKYLVNNVDLTGERIVITIDQNIPVTEETKVEIEKVK
jgi:hypothetical protein